MASTPSAPRDLRTEHFLRPLGLGPETPRLSWKLTDDRRGAIQTAYQIVAEGDVSWDSGRVESRTSVLVPWTGPALGSRAQVTWRVRVWDQEGTVGEWSEPTTFAMGLHHRSDWTAKWIAAPLAGTKTVSVPAPLLRRTFTLTERPVRARVFSSALGLLESTLNGARISDAVFTPGWTDYGKRVQYTVDDVTDQLVDGENVLGVMLGDGWYCGYVGPLPRQGYGARPALLMQLELTYADGRTETIVSDEQWRTTPGPVIASDMLMGEVYDARQEHPGWPLAGFADADWARVITLPDPNIELSSMLGGPMRRQQELRSVVPPRNVGSDPAHPIWQFDLGQNMVGWVRLRVSGEAGDEIILHHSEVLQADGRLYLTPLRAAKATDTYVLKGGGEEVYEPHFTFHGFRYIEVQNLREAPTADTVIGVVVHSDIPRIGAFECSEPLLNQFVRNVDWGQRGNFVDIPTDCPQRDERLGWTGDAQVFIRAACFNRDVVGFFHKWARDVEDAQFDSGSIPPVVPDPSRASVWGPAGPAWEDAAVIVPWTVYRTSGDRRVLERAYPTLTRWIPYLVSSAKDDVRCAVGSEIFEGFGDWLNINAETPKDVIGTAFFAFSVRLAAQVATVLGHEDDAQRWTALADRVKAKFQSAFITPDGDVVGRTQTAYVLALQMDLAPSELRAKIAQRLVEDITRRGDHLSTGFVGAPLINWALTGSGHLETAFKLINQKTCPSWLFPVTQGATTIWERWDGYTPEKGFQDPSMNSFNHYAYGSVLDWLVGVVAGLDLDPQVPGYRSIHIAPNPGGGLTEAAASLETPYGFARSAWRIDNDRFTLEVTVPPNSEAEVRVPYDHATGDGLIGESVPEGTRFTVSAGTYRLTAPLPR